MTAALQQLEAELSAAHRRAADRLRTDFTNRLARFKLHHHNITIKPQGLCIGPRLWWECRIRGEAYQTLEEIGRIVDELHPQTKTYLEGIL